MLHILSYYVLFAQKKCNIIGIYPVKGLFCGQNDTFQKIVEPLCVHEFQRI